MDSWPARPCVAGHDHAWGSFPRSLARQGSCAGALAHAFRQWSEVGPTCLFWACPGRAWALYSQPVDLCPWAADRASSAALAPRALGYSLSLRWRGGGGVWHSSGTSKVRKLLGGFLTMTNTTPAGQNSWGDGLFDGVGYRCGGTDFGERHAYL